MVFCYKLITESPRRCGSVSPRRSYCHDLDSNFKLHNEVWRCEDVGSIPARDWRLLAALARKRDERDERDRLAEQFQRMWQEERGQREKLAAETSEQYRRYVERKRDADRRWLEHRRATRGRESQMHRALLLDAIQQKQRRSADLLACLDDMKSTTLVERCLEEDYRAALAAGRRARQGAAHEWRLRTELAATVQRATEAHQRRNARLRDSARRVAISNALNSWETSLLRSEVLAVEENRRAGTVARLISTEEKSRRIERNRIMRQSRARRAAAIAAQMRDAVRGYRL